MKALNSVMFIALFVATLSVCESQVQVRVYGELRAIMQRGDLSPKVLLDTLNLKETTIGLGVASDLEGEIIIVNGKVYVSHVEDGKIESEQTSKLTAAMLVMYEVGISDHLVSVDIDSIEHLEKFIGGYARSQPLAFIINADEGEVFYHVIDWKQGVAHTPGNHKQFAIRASFSNENVIMIGFYSEQAGVFTPHTSKLHLHVYDPKTGIVGHVEEIRLRNPGIEIF